MESDGTERRTTRTVPFTHDIRRSRILRSLQIQRRAKAKGIPTMITLSRYRQGQRTELTIVERLTLTRQGTIEFHDTQINELVTWELDDDEHIDIEQI